MTVTDHGSVGEPDAPDTTGVTSPIGSSGFLSGVMAEIDQEVRRRRAAGEFPPSFERRLDLLFSRFTPVGAKTGHFEEALNLADRSAYVDIDVPMRSNMVGVSLLKRVLRQLMAWYLNYVVQQLVRFNSAAVRVLHMFDERLGDLEQESRARRPDPLVEEDRMTPAELRAALEPRPPLAGSESVTAFPAADAEVGEWAGLVRRCLSGASGRVLHAECASGGLLAALVADGLDAYGADSRAHLLDLPSARGLDVRRECVLDHLRAVAEGSLEGLVLSGCVDHLPVREQRALADLAVSRLAPGGRVVVVGTTPNAWAQGAPVIEVDLAPGRPLHPETWAHLLERRGFVGIQVHRGQRDASLIPLPDDGPVSAALNANLASIDNALFGPASFAVVATRGS